MSAAPTSRLKVSREGIALIKSFEGFRPHATPDGNGGWVIGYGHTAYAREGLTIRQPDAELLLQYDLLPVVKALNDGVATPPNQHQFDALASFALSIGLDRFMASDVLRRLNAGLVDGAAEALFGWPETLPPDAALRRRAAERALFGADPAAPVHLIDLLSAPLMPFPVSPPPAPPSAAGARAAAVAALLGERPDVVSTAAAPAQPVAGPALEAEPLAFQSAVFPGAEASEPGADRYSPYGASPVGPLPGFPIESAAEAAPQAEAASFPTMQPPQVVTPATETADGEAAPSVPASDDVADAPVADAAAPVDEPVASVLRHEVEPAPARRFDWGETGAFLIIGGFGLAACGGAAAAFRLAVEHPAPSGETTVIAWALAVIGVLCVGVSSWNLYVRWGKPD